MQELEGIDLQKFREATPGDETLQEVIKLVTVGGEWWRNEKVMKFKTAKDEFSVASGLVLQGDRIVVPRKLKRKVIRIAHSGHQGILKTKSFLRETVWFPGRDKTSQEILRGCIPCLAKSNKLIIKSTTANDIAT